MHNYTNKYNIIHFFHLPSTGYRLRNIFEIKKLLKNNVH